MTHYGDNADYHDQEVMTRRVVASLMVVMVTVM